MSRRPLYQGSTAAGRARSPGGHAGLWFDKFCDRWTARRGGWAMSARRASENPKLEWIHTVANETPVGSKKQVEEYADRVVRLVRALGGRFAVFEADSRFVSGLGRSQPVENGFAWHPTLGTPYLPGSSTKGLVRAWARDDAKPTLDQATMNRVFGGGGETELGGSIGTVCFLDAFPVARTCLDADVVTPHYANWTPADPPGDWRSPKPIPFLTTRSGTRFLFSVIPCHRAAKGDLTTVFGWLESALAIAGAGAKTAVGYGRFRRCDEATLRLVDRVEGQDRKRRAERLRREAMKTPEGRWRLRLAGMSETQVLEEVRVGLEKGTIDDPAERSAFATTVRALGFLKHWRRGKAKTKTNVGAKKLRLRARLVQSVLTDS